MSRIRLEAVIGDEFEGGRQEARSLIKKFINENQDDIKAKKTTVVDRNGNKSEQINGYDRKSEIWWTSIAVLLISNPEGVIQFLKWASDIPGLTIGYTVQGDIRFKIFDEIDFTLIDNSTNYNVEKVGETEDYVLAKIPLEDWTHLYDDAKYGDLDIEIPPEDEIGP
ncbi:hypothetical protein [Haloferax volcanii]|uniref:hypothetical protein n=1 Tax=Haloferax volcanii TaxID=2246 RepID=UPI001266F505|nr:hypothetical protein [Haloferax lucentense]